VANAPEHSHSNPTGSVLRLGRYVLFGEIARGGMATVHFGRLLGSVGFSRTVAIKRLHPHFAADHDFVSMFVDEARLAARIQHPNVISTLDVVVEGNELALVMDYVQGASLARLIHTSKQLKSRVPIRVVCAVMLGVLAGLHAAHEAKNERGEPLGIVHRDMSPQNVLVGADGVARVFDFGIAKAAGRLQTTREGQFKGKLSYAAPEQLSLGESDRRTDVYSAAVIFWELLTLRRAFRSDNQLHVLKQVMGGEISRPSEHVEGIPEAVEAIVMRGLSKNPDDRFANAEEMALALERVQPYASAREVSEWVAAVAGDELHARAKEVEELELNSQTLVSTHDVPTLVRQLERHDEIDASDLLESTTSQALPSTRRTSAPTAAAPPSVPASSASSPSSPSSPSSQTAQAAQRSGRSAATWILLALLAIAVVAGSGFAWVQTRPQLSADTFTRKAPPQILSTAIQAKVEDVRAVTPPGAAESTAPPIAAASSGAPKPPTGAGFAAPSTLVAPPGSTGTVVAPPPSSTSPPSPSATAPTPPAANCTPAYTIDENGIRHPKPECL
jgi:serine/threonine-protein kinase